MRIPLSFLRAAFVSLFAFVAFFTLFRLLAPAAEPAAAPAALARVALFGSDACPHCRDAISFLEENAIPFSYQKVESAAGREAFWDAAKKLQLGSAAATPLLLVESEPAAPAVFIGFDAADTTGRAMQNALAACEKQACEKPAALLSGGSLAAAAPRLAANCGLDGCEADNPFSVSIPFMGELNFAAFGLPVATALLGIIDGFNPCAMWALVTLLTLLVALGSRQKMWLIGGTFIFISGAVYYFFIAAQGALLGLLGVNVFVVSAIALLAIGAGLFYLYEFLAFDAGVCAVTNAAQKSRLVEKMRAAVSSRFLPATLLGVAGVAVSVNLIELACTAGLPVIFNGLLLLWEVGALEKHAYYLGYIFFYMLDDLLLFAIAVKTMQLVSFSGRFSKSQQPRGGAVDAWPRRLAAASAGRAFLAGCPPALPPRAFKTVAFFW